MNINPLSAIDFYKSGHGPQYPENTTMVYSNLTARSDKHAPELAKGGVVVFGIQAFILDFLIDSWNVNFFFRTKEAVLEEYAYRMNTSLGPGLVGTEHIAALHDLGFLPLEIKALPEGTYAPIGIPVLTIRNTIPEFFWLTNYLESVMSAELWKPITTATIAHAYRRLLDQWCEITGGDKEFVAIQGHDFSFRGMGGLQDAAKAGMGHLLSFIGTDTVPAIDAAQEFYAADEMFDGSEGALSPVGVSVPATEHSVMCMGGHEDELETFRRLIEDLYPTGIISIVSDTWDFWRVMTEYLPTLKEKVLSRDGKVVIRPDSGNPVDIVCGDLAAEPGTPEHFGAVELLWNTFGGTVNEKGFKQLNEKVGLIYGDSITLERAQNICERLAAKGFASTNIVFGIGSYTYQYVTRDTYGMAVKATYGEVDGQAREIFKDPATDDGIKKSARGLLKVREDLSLQDQVSWEEEQQGALETVFLNGELTNFQNFYEIRALLNG